MFGRTKDTGSFTTAPSTPDAPRPAPAPAPEVTLGALRSEFDQNRSVAEQFTTVAELTEQILDLYRHGRMGQLVALRALAALRLVDAGGASWALGATTRRWQRRLPGGAWRVAVPPSVGDEQLESSCAAAIAAVQEVLGVDAADAPTDPPAPTGDLDVPAEAAAPVTSAEPGSAAEDEVASDDESARLLAEFMASTGSSATTPAPEPEQGGYGYGD